MNDKPIIYQKNNFPEDLCRDQNYIAHSVGWNDGYRKFCLKETRGNGWNVWTTTSGAFDTFAEAYKEAEKAAYALAASLSCPVCLLDRDDNRQDLIGSWGMSKVQTEELMLSHDEIFYKAANNLQDTLLTGEYGTFSDVCVEQRLNQDDHKLVIWGEENDDDDKFYSVCIYTLDRYGEPDVQILSTFSESEKIEDLKVAVLDVLKRFDEKMLSKEHAPETSEPAAPVKETQMPDELVVRLAHYAGEMEAKGQIAAPEWDDLCAAIRDAIDEYYGHPNGTNPFVVEDIADKVFRERFPVREHSEPTIEPRYKEAVLLTCVHEHDYGSDLHASVHASNQEALSHVNAVKDEMDFEEGKAGESFNFDIESVIIDISKLKDAQSFDRNAPEKHDFTVETPHGTLHVFDKKDPEYPGVWVNLQQPDGNDIALAMVEYIPGGESLSGYSPNDPALMRRERAEVPESRRNGQTVTEGFVTRAWSDDAHDSDHTRTFHTGYKLPMEKNVEQSGRLSSLDDQIRNAEGKRTSEHIPMAQTKEHQR